MPNQQPILTNPRQSPPPPSPELVRRRGGIFTVPRRLILRQPDYSHIISPRIPMKLLLNVNVEGSFGPIPIVILKDQTVEDLVKVVVETYVMEKRRPLLTESDHRKFELHYSPFSLESLKMDEKLLNLGSRNFYMCRKPPTAVSGAGTGAGSSMSNTCNSEAEEFLESGFLITKLLFLL
ncbi:uncharacterized protein At4g22758-like [Impatiens glandulifera]|uniref:uncharacterized protein At4g22758-like n=1 Tax=Impatiens glandulifera TaxID=253017 RepID=UPI001FB11943|nr:uncharacterized protein At4g22758-like [Impatiens glandulifera]